MASKVCDLCLVSKRSGTSNSVEAVSSLSRFIKNKKITDQAALFGAMTAPGWRLCEWHADSLSSLQLILGTVLASKKGGGGGRGGGGLNIHYIVIIHCVTIRFDNVISSSIAAVVAPTSAVFALIEDVNRTPRLRVLDMGSRDDMDEMRRVLRAELRLDTRQFEALRAQGFGIPRALSIAIRMPGSSGLGRRGDALGARGRVLMPLPVSAAGLAVAALPANGAVHRALALPSPPHGAGVQLGSGEAGAPPNHGGGNHEVGCGHCGRSFSKADFLDHVFKRAKCASAKRIYKCPGCNATFKQKNAMRACAMSHAGACTCCGQPEALAKPKSEWELCKSCLRRYPHVKEHRAFDHRSHQCGNCLALFCTASAVRAHASRCFRKKKN